MVLKPFLLILSLSIQAHSYKILAVFPHAGKSHLDVFLSLTKALAEKGHDVTVVSHFPLQNPPKNYHDVLIKCPQLSLLTDVIGMTDYLPNRAGKWLEPVTLNTYSQISCRCILDNADYRNLLNQNHRFDVVLMEFFNSDCALAAMSKFKVPIIGISSCVIMHWTNERFGNPTHPAYIPNALIGFSHQMTFMERVENFVISNLHELYFAVVMRGNDYRIAKEVLGDQISKLEEVARKSSLLLVNTHFSLNLPRPLVPAVIEVGGIHIGKLKQLPADLEKWINDSTHGVIYFSLGSMIKGHTFPEEKRKEFLKAFARLPQRVLWKWENDSMPDKPDNVMLRKWMPQLDILCHPNVKAFISHGGLLGTTEAVHCGVPAVIMPQYGDQHTNARAMEANGGGIILQLYEATEQKVYDALQEVLTPEFRKGAQELSARFKDRPMPPLETAIYWVEYVARHKGAHHMRTAAVDMPLYKYLLLDVIAFLLLVAGVVGFVFFYLTKKILKKLFGRKLKQKTN